MSPLKIGMLAVYITPGRMIDRDRDGLLSVSELRVFLTSLGDRMTEEEVGEMLRLYCTVLCCTVL